MASRTVFLNVALLLTAVACSGSDSKSAPIQGSHPGGGATSDAGADEPVADASVTTTAAAVRSVCTTLDYGHTRTNADFYMQFDSDDAAFTYSKDFLAANQMPNGVEVSHDARMVGLIATVYAGLQKVFPKETAGLDTPPRIVTVDDNTVNAFAGFDERPQYNKAPWMFWINTGTVNANLPDEQLEGLFGHELAHLILRNNLPETRAKIRTHYRVVGQKEQGVIGEIQPDDPAVDTHAEQLRGLGALVARDFVADTLPYSPFEGATYEGMLTTLQAQENTSPNPNDCTTADDTITKMKNIYNAAASVHTIKLALTDAQKTQLETLGNTATTALKSCYSHVAMSLFELKIRNATTGQNADDVNTFIKKALDPTTAEHQYAYSQLMTNDVEQTVDSSNADPTTIARVVDVVQQLHKQVLSLEGDPTLPIAELRVYDLEEDADDAAVRVLLTLGKDPLAGGRLYVNQMDDPNGCYQSVAAGNVPAYGDFIDPHNETCWRWFHINQLAAALGNCPGTSPASTSGAATNAFVTHLHPVSPTDRSPMDLVRWQQYGLR